VFFEVSEGVIHRDDGALAFELLVGAIEREVGITVEEIEASEPVVEALGAGAGGAFFLNGTDVPFSEVRGEVSGFFESFGDGDFLGTKVMTVVGDIGADGMSAGEDGGAGGGANGSGRVEAVEDDRVLGHVVEVGSLDEGMPGVAAVAVALVIGHDENDMGRLRGESQGRKAQCETEKKA